VFAQNNNTTPEGLTPTPTSWRLTSETLHLPGAETMGLIGGDLLFDLNEHLRLGVGSYGAVRGARGGFITLGLAGEVQQRLSTSWVGHAGLYVGAGGGRSSNTLAGGGLMLRSDVGLSYETSGYGNFGFGLSHVSFPSGVIRSTQPYIQYELPFYSLVHSGWSPAPARDTGSAEGIRANGQEFSLVARNYTIPSTVPGPNGQPYGRMQLMGVQWLSAVNQHWFVQLEAEGAMGGKSNGYMQILAGGGYRLALSNSTALKFHAAAGPAGGGGVDDGGGLLLDAGLAVQQQITRNNALEFSLGEVRAPSGNFKARSLALQLTHQFGTPAVSSSDVVSWRALDNFDTEHLRVRAVSQTYFKANPQWRSSDAQLSVSNLGVQLDYFAAPHWYFTGQGLAAYAGKAGAYMTGLVGAGTQWPITQRCFVEAEMLVGAAGGGGLAVAGGLVGQANVGIGYQLSKPLALLVTAGDIAAARGPFKAYVAGLALTYQFTGFTAK
jgi:hypothetical protein